MALKKPLVTICPYCRSRGRISGEVPEEGTAFSCPSCRGSFIVFPDGRLTRRRGGEPESPPRRRYEEHHLLFARQLESELPVWIRAGIITPEQGERILDRYDMIRRNSSRPRIFPRLKEYALTVGVVILLVLLLSGGMLLSATLGREGRVSLLAAAAVLFEGGGYLLRKRGGRYHDLGSLVVLVGALCYGALLHAVSTLYDFPFLSPVWLLFWSAGVIPLAYAISSRSLLSLGLLVPLSWPLIDSPGELFSVETAARLATVGTIGSGYRGIASLHRALFPSPLARSWELLGNAAVLVALVPFTLPLFWRTGFAPVDPLVAAAGAIAVLAGGVPLVRSDDPFRIHQLSVGIVLVLLFAAGGTLPPLSSVSLAAATVAGNVIYGVVVLLAFNLAFLNGSAALVNAGVVSLMLYLLSHYGAMFRPYLSDGIFYGLGGGVLVIGGIFLERKRKVILSHLGDGAEG